jgi:hypothetical protein
VKSGLLVRQGDKAAAVYRFLAKAKRIQDAESYPKKGRTKRA